MFKATFENYKNYFDRFYEDRTFQSLNECDDYLELTRGTTSKVLNGKGKTLKKLYIPKLAS